MSHTGLLSTEIDIKAGILYPIFHIACQGMTFGTLLCGGTAVIVRGVDHHALVEAISEEKNNRGFCRSIGFLQNMRYN